MGFIVDWLARLKQHATSEADQAIAEAMNALLPQPENEGDEDDDQGDDEDGSAVPRLGGR